MHKDHLQHWQKLGEEWAQQNFLGLVTLNVILMVLVMLHSAGYFEPYLPITINLVILMGVIIMRLVLKVTSQTVFSLTIFFMVFAALLRLSNITIWAERSMIYGFETFMVGVIALLAETILKMRK